MKLDGLRTYKYWLLTIEQNKSRLNRLVGKATCQGVTSIDQLESLGKELQEHIKDAMAFVQDPFEPATFDNMMKSGENVGSAYQVACYEPSEIEFDARDIIDLKRLNALVELDFKCVVAIKSRQGLSLPKALVAFDSMLCEIIGKAAATLNPSVEYDALLSITGKEPMTEDGQYHSLITYRIADEQIYFTKEEKQAIEDAHRAEEQAREDARRKAVLDEQIAQYKDKLATLLGEASMEEIMTRVKAPADIIALYEVLIDKNLIREFNDGYEFVSDGSISNDIFAITARLLSRDEGKETYSFYCPDNYQSLDNENDHNSLPAGTVIRLTIEK